MEGYDYDEAAASTIKIEDITTDDINLDILCRLKHNDGEFMNLLWVMGRHQDNHDYRPEGAHDMGWLGHYVGKNTYLHPFTAMSSSSSVGE